MYLECGTSSKSVWLIIYSICGNLDKKFFFNLGFLLFIISFVFLLALMLFQLIYFVAKVILLCK
jgi:hypothetical protein